MKFKPLYILCGNGWEWHHYNTDWLIQMDDSEEYTQYTLKVLGYGYYTIVRAVVSEFSQHLCINGHYGVIWLDAAKYENNPPYEENALKDMIKAIERAEDNLIKIGMPFCPDYKFHGRNKANKKRRNDKLRRLYDLERFEKEGISP